MKRPTLAQKKMYDLRHLFLAKRLEQTKVMQILF